MVRLSNAAFALAIFTILCASASNLEAKSKVKLKPLAITSANELIIKRNYKAAFAFVQTQANGGDAAAALRLAEFYRIGLGTTKNDVAAREWLQKSADAGNRKARALLQNLDQNPVAATVKKTAGDTTSAVALVDGIPDFSKLPKRREGQPDWLTLAAARKNPNVIAALSKSADLDKSNQAIFAAIKNGDINTSQQLLTGKAGTSTDLRGQTALMLAINSGNPELINVVLQSKLDIAAKSLNGKTAVDIAVQNCQPRILAKLIENGAPVGENESSFQPLIMVVQNCNNWPEFKPYFKAANFSVTDALGRTAAWYAAAKGDASLLAWLLESGADLGFADKEGFTPLHAAAANKQPFAIRYILSKSDGADRASARGTTPLMLAAAAGCRDCISPLIEKTSDINLKNNDGDTALIYAVRGRQSAVAAQLIEKGGNADARNGSGDNANKLAELIGLTILKGSTQ
jgi:ankyrin repeat protein